MPDSYRQTRSDSSIHDFPSVEPRVGFDVSRHESPCIIGLEELPFEITGLEKPWAIALSLVKSNDHPVWFGKILFQQKKSVF